MKGIVNRLKDNNLLFFSLLISIILSIWSNYRDPVVNPDAICYLLSAQTIGDGGLTNAMQLCGQARWPFYSVLIYGLAKWGIVSYTTAAYLLDGFFSLLSVAAFLMIVKELKGTGRVLLFAALTILLAHQFNSVRVYIIRDHGFWAFYLLSIGFLLRYFRAWHYRDAALFAGSLFIATLFRIEGAFFLLALPILSWFIPGAAIKKRANAFFILNVPVMILTLIIAVWLMLHPERSLQALGRVVEIPHHLQHGLTLMWQRFDASKTALAQSVLTHDSANQAGLVWGLTLVSWYIFSIADNLSWIYTFLLIYALWHCMKRWPAHTKIVLAGYLLINVAITFGFLLENLFLSKRYLIAFSLLLMVAVPFALDDLLNKSIKWRQKWLFGLVILAMSASAVGGLFEFKYSKVYVRDAGEWLSKHVPADASLYANDEQLMYYSAHFGNRIFDQSLINHKLDSVTAGQWKQYDYLALRMNKKEEAQYASLLNEMKLEPIQVFSNKRQDRVVIYKVFSKEKVS